MERERVMDLNIAVWMGVIGVVVSWAGCDAGCGLVVLLLLLSVLVLVDPDGDWKLRWLWTSSFRTRPSRPVPEMSAMSRLCSLRRARTAGVAR